MDYYGLYVWIGDYRLVVSAHSTDWNLLVHGKKEWIDDFRPDEEQEKYKILHPEILWEIAFHDISRMSLSLFPSLGLASSSLNLWLPHSRFILWLHAIPRKLWKSPKNYQENLKCKSYGREKCSVICKRRFLKFKAKWMRSNSWVL